MIETIISDIKEQYLDDDYPWVIAYSGGKDSTVALQLIFKALSEIEPIKKTKEVHVLSNDTLVENPIIDDYLNEQLNKILQSGRQTIFKHNPNLFQVNKITPKIEDSFWLNLIGKGYPSPNRWFRWCTERLKINPTNDYIIQTVNKHGKVIIVLGTRKSESNNRQKSMQQYEVNGVRLRKHTLPNAFVFAPIAEMTNFDVWDYLRKNKNPWGTDNNKLIELYKNASTVFDHEDEKEEYKEIYGIPRFGCWVCTVVDKDRSMMNLINNGEKWLKPMLDFRDWLAEIRNDETKRDTLRRNGQPGVGARKLCRPWSDGPFEFVYEAIGLPG